MNITEYLLTKLGEEGNEVSQAVTKALCFGLDETNVLKPDGPNNRARIVDELNDLMAVAGMLVRIGVLPTNWENQEKQEAKVRKVLKFLHYSAMECGTLYFPNEVLPPAWNKIIGEERKRPLIPQDPSDCPSCKLMGAANCPDHGIKEGTNGV